MPPQWYFDKGPLPDNAEVEQKAILILRNIDLQNNGHYYCSGWDKDRKFLSRSELRVVGVYRVGLKNDGVTGWHG